MVDLIIHTRQHFQIFTEIPAEKVAWRIGVICVLLAGCPILATSCRLLTSEEYRHIRRNITLTDIQILSDSCSKNH